MDGWDGLDYRIEKIRKDGRLLLFLAVLTFNHLRDIESLSVVTPQAPSYTRYNIGYLLYCCLYRCTSMYDMTCVYSRLFFQCTHLRELGIREQHVCMNV